MLKYNELRALLAFALAQCLLSATSPSRGALVELVQLGEWAPRPLRLPPRLGPHLVFSKEEVQALQCRERAGLQAHFVLLRGSVPPPEVAELDVCPAAAAPKMRCNPLATVKCVARWNISRGGFEGKAHGDTCQRQRPRAQKRLRGEQEGVSGGTRASSVRSVAGEVVVLLHQTKTIGDTALLSHHPCCTRQLDNTTEHRPHELAL